MSAFDIFNRNAKKTADPHLEMWKKWDSSGRHPDHLEPLMDALEPTVQQHAKRVHSGVGGSIPYAAVEAKYRVSAKMSLDKYDPSKGMKVRNFVLNEFKRTTDFIDANRNFASVPGSRVGLYQRFQNAKNAFITEHGHEPTFEELKVLLPDIPERQLKPLMTEFRRELYIGGNPDPESSDDSSLEHHASEVQTLLSLMPGLLTPDEKKVFAELRLAGPDDRKAVNVAAIARKTGMTQNQVYRHRAAIMKKVEPHLRKM